MEWKLLTYQVKFKIRNAGLNVDGVFTGLQTTIKFDPNAAAESYILASVESKTVNSDNSMRDNHLKKSDYFDVVKYPKITIESTGITLENAQHYKGVFKITIKNKTKELTIPFTFVEKDGKATFEGKFVINRKDFGIGGSSFILSDNVEIVVKLNVIK